MFLSDNTHFFWACCHGFPAVFNGLSSLEWMTGCFVSHRAAVFLNSAWTLPLTCILLHCLSQCRNVNSSCKSGWEVVVWRKISLDHFPVTGSYVHDIYKITLVQTVDNNMISDTEIHQNILMVMSIDNKHTVKQVLLRRIQGLWISHIFDKSISWCSMTYSLANVISYVQLHSWTDEDINHCNRCVNHSAKKKKYHKF